MINRAIALFISLVSAASWVPTLEYDADAYLYYLSLTIGTPSALHPLN